MGRVVSAHPPWSTATSTSTTISAEQRPLAGLPSKPGPHIEKIKADHERDSAAFLIDFANFHSTHSEENRHWSEDIYGRLKANGHIAGPSQRLQLSGKDLLEAHVVSGCCKLPFDPGVPPRNGIEWTLESDRLDVTDGELGVLQVHGDVLTTDHAGQVDAAAEIVGAEHRDLRQVARSGHWA